MIILYWFLIFLCGSLDISIIKGDFVIRNKQKNEIVMKYSNYLINCMLDYNFLKKQKVDIYINDELINFTPNITIFNDTKIECIVTLEKNKTIKHTTLITAVDNYNETTKSQFSRSECTQFSVGENNVCRNYFEINSFPKRYFLNEQTRKLIEEFMNNLYQGLNNNFYNKYGERDGCVDRLISLMCAFLYPNCNPVKLVCRDTCNIILKFLCKSAYYGLTKEINAYRARYQINIFRYSEFARYQHEIDFMVQLSDYLNDITNCNKLEQHRLISTKSNPDCLFMDLENLDLSRHDEIYDETCYNNQGRLFNYTANGHGVCMDWSNLPPKLIQSFQSSELTKVGNKCRNPGNIFIKPSCLIPTYRYYKYGILEKQLSYLRIHHCKDALMCSFKNENKTRFKNKYTKIKHFEKAMFIIFIGLCGLLIYTSYKQYLSKQSEDLPNLLTDASRTIRDSILLNYPSSIGLRLDNFGPSTTIISSNKSDTNVSNYNRTGYNDMGVFEFEYCPIYNKEFLQSIKKLGRSKFGQLELVKVYKWHQSKFDDDKNSTSNTEDDEFFSSSKKLIMSADIEFDNQQCWPYNLTNNSDQPQLAVIEYCQNLRDDEIRVFRKHSKLLASLNNDNIIRFYGVVFDSLGSINARLLEYLPKGNLRTFLRRKNSRLVEYSHQIQSVSGNIRFNHPSIKSLPKSSNNKVGEVMKSGDAVKLPVYPRKLEIDNKRLMAWAIQISSAIEYLHRNRIIHRDVKAQSCMLDKNFDAKLADCSYLVVIEDNTYFTKVIVNSENEGIPFRWLPKETLHTNIFSTRSDVHMFGVFLWELMSYGEKPYAYMTNDEAYRAIINNLQLPIPSGCPSHIYNLINTCCSSEDIRPSIHTISEILRKYLMNMQKEKRVTFKTVIKTEM